MRNVPLLAAAMICASGMALGQTSIPDLLARPDVATAPMGAAAPTQPAAKPGPSTAEARSPTPAPSSEPVFDGGTIGRIKEAAQSYSDIAVRGGWPTIPTDAKFANGVAGPNDDLLRKRLVISGDLADDSPGPFDDKLADGIRRFQARHGLAVTGTMTPRTLAALNVPVQRRIQQLEASLARLVNMQFGFGQRYVVVNIPAAYAEAIEDDRVVRRYRVIVGKTEKPSPTLTAEISNVNLNPTWTVPASITKNEIAAHMRKDPTYISRMHMDVLGAHDEPIDPGSVDWSAGHTPNFTVRQQSGAWNALGSVRIDMPNSYSVYMHDTNQKNLFADDYRFDSHGCARVENVRDLAAWLLRDLPKWSRAEIDAAIARGQREDIHLPNKVPVAWIYLTGWMSRDQAVHFRNDVYDQDVQLLEATAEEEAFFGHAAEHAPQPPATKKD